MKWCQTKTRHSFHHSPPVSDPTVRFNSLFRCNAFDIASSNLTPILLPVDMKRNGNSKLLMDIFCASYFFCLHNADQALWVLCLISMIRSMMLLRCPQSCSLLRRWEMPFVCLFFPLTTHIKFKKSCGWFQWFTQWCCSSFSNAVHCWWEEKERVNCWWLSFVCLSFVFTFQIEFSECCVWFQ